MNYDRAFLTELKNRVIVDQCKISFGFIKTTLSGWVKAEQNIKLTTELELNWTYAKPLSFLRYVANLLPH